MTLDADQVVVGSFGHVYVAPTGTALPATIAAAITAMAGGTWKDLGYIDENGVSFTEGLDEQDILSWQTLDPIRKIVTARRGSLTASLMQINQNTLPFAFGGGVWTPGAGLSFVYEFPLASAGIQEKAVLVDVEDGATQIVFAFYRCVISADVTTQFVRNSAAKLPVTMSFLSDSTAGNIGRIVGVGHVGS